MTMNIVITGSIAYDYIMTFPGYFRDHVLPEKVADSINLSFLVENMVRRRGGVACGVLSGGVEPPPGGEEGGC